MKKIILVVILLGCFVTQAFSGESRAVVSQNDKIFSLLRKLPGAVSKIQQNNQKYGQYLVVDRIQMGCEELEDIENGGFKTQVRGFIRFSKNQFIHGFYFDESTKESCSDLNF